MSFYIPLFWVLLDECAAADDPEYLVGEVWLVLHQGDVVLQRVVAGSGQVATREAGMATLHYFLDYVCCNTLSKVVSRKEISGWST